MHPDRHQTRSCTTVRCRCIHRSVVQMTRCSNLPRRSADQRSDQRGSDRPYSRSRSIWTLRAEQPKAPINTGSHARRQPSSNGLTRRFLKLFPKTEDPRRVKRQGSSPSAAAVRKGTAIGSHIRFGYCETPFQASHPGRAFFMHLTTGQNDVTVSFHDPERSGQQSIGRFQKTYCRPPRINCYQTAGCSGSRYGFRSGSDSGCRRSCHHRSDRHRGCQAR